MLCSFFCEPLRQGVFEVFAQHETQPIGRVPFGGGSHRGRTRRLAAIDDANVGQPPAADALGQRDQRVRAARRVRPALEARSRAPEHHHRALATSAHDRDLAGVVTRRLALLVARLVLLVDDDRAEVGERREDRRARANGDSLASLAQREPFVVPLAVAERAVQHRDGVAELGAKAIDGLRRERDLGHEHDRRLSIAQNEPLEKLEVDERLAAAGDPVKEKDVSALAASERHERVSLRRRGLVPPRRGRRTTGKRIARHRLGGQRHQLALHQRPQDGRRELVPLGEVLDRHGPADRLDQLEQRPLLRLASKGFLALEERRQIVADGDDAPRAPRRLGSRVRRERCRQRAADHDSERSDIVLGDPRAE